MTASAISTATPSCASVVEAPRWGVHTTSGRPTRGLSVGGSFSNTSSAACPQRWPHLSHQPMYHVFEGNLRCTGVLRCPT